MDGFYRVVSSDLLSAQVAADYILDIGFERLMTVATDEAYGKGGERMFKSYLPFSVQAPWPCAVKYLLAYVLIHLRVIC